MNVTLDADFAQPSLIVSEDGKQLKCGNTQAVNEGNTRFIEYLGVLGKEGFSSGCFYFELQVNRHTVWDLVARESANREELISVLRIDTEH